MKATQVREIVSFCLGTHQKCLKLIYLYITQNPQQHGYRKATQVTEIISLFLFGHPPKLHYLMYLYIYLRSPSGFS